MVFNKTNKTTTTDYMLVWLFLPLRMREERKKKHTTPTAVAPATAKTTTTKITTQIITIMEHNQAGIVMVIQHWAVYKYESVTIQHTIRIQNGDTFLWQRKWTKRAYFDRRRLFEFQILKDSELCITTNNNNKNNKRRQQEQSPPKRKLK